MFKAQNNLIVIGAGVAGLSAAIAARRAGLEVTVLERGEVPPVQAGETLHPGVQTIFKELGLINAVEKATRIRPLGLEVVGHATERIPYGGTAQAPWRGYQVNRNCLSDIMVTAASNLGASLKFGTRVCDIDATSDQVIVELEQERLSASWCCDATGVAQLSSRKHSGTVSPISPTLVLRYRYDRKGSVCREWPRLVVSDQGWNWEAMVDDDRFAIVELVRGRFKGPREPGWNYADGTWRLSDAPADGRVFKVGDAAGRVDPAAGKGILRSMMSAMMMVHLIKFSIAEALLPARISAHYSNWFRNWVANDAHELRQLLECR